MANKFYNQPGSKRSLLGGDTPTFSKKSSKRSFSGLKMKEKIRQQIYNKQ